MLKKVYVEITNRCNLACSFCPGTTRPPRDMRPAEFRQILQKIAPHTRYVYLHVMGEPLLHPELAQLLALCREAGLRVCLTTNGSLLARRGGMLLAAPALHKVSVSLHCAEVNEALLPLPGYLEQVWTFCAAAAGKGILCSLRLWNQGGENARNREILAFLREKSARWEELPDGSVRLGERLYLQSARRFDWPDLQAPPQQTQFCYGLRDQVAVLADGSVTPCCLDHEGDITLGNLFTQRLEDILDAPRARALYDGFSRRRPAEELCRRCGYAVRFNR